MLRGPVIGPARTERELAARDVREMRRTHVLWIEHLDACRGCPDEHAVGDREHHRQAVEKYDRILRVLGG